MGKIPLPVSDAVLPICGTLHKTHGTVGQPFVASAPAVGQMHGYPKQMIGKMQDPLPHGEGGPGAFAGRMRNPVDPL